MASPEIIHGACNCGRITVSLPRSAFPTASSLCHCLNCRASGGSLSVYPTTNCQKFCWKNILVSRWTYLLQPKISRSRDNPRFIATLQCQEMQQTGISAQTADRMFSTPISVQRWHPQSYNDGYPTKTWDFSSQRRSFRKIRRWSPSSRERAVLEKSRKVGEAARRGYHACGVMYLFLDFS